jgi:hypothetical protein
LGRKPHQKLVGREQHLVAFVVVDLEGCLSLVAAPSISVSVTRYLSHQFSNATTMDLRCAEM